LADCGRNDQDIGKEDCRVERKALERLQRDIGRCIGIIDEIESSLSPLEVPDIPAGTGQPGASSTLAPDRAVLREGRRARACRRA
jgi:hypothetical protein